MSAMIQSLTAWYAVHTKPRQEVLAYQSLAREGVATFFPKLRRRKTIRGERKLITGPLFPCYIFANFDYHTNHRLVKYASGVANIVNFGGRPALVEDTMIAAITEHAENDVVTIEPAAFAPGQVVEIKSGPLMGLQGIFERELPDRDRVVILLDVLARGARVQVSRDELEMV